MSAGTIEKYIQTISLLDDVTLVELHGSLNTSLAALWATNDPMFIEHKVAIPMYEDKVMTFKNQRTIVQTELLHRIRKKDDPTDLSDRDLYVLIDTLKKEFHKRMVGTDD